MQVVQPIVITPSQVTATSLVNLDADWDSATTYNLGDRVTYNNVTYESTLDSNINYQPDTNYAKWSIVGSSNQWAVWDDQISSQSTATTFIEVTFEPGAVDTVAILNILGNTISITVRDTPGGNIIYSGNQSLAGSVVLDWFQYFFFDSTTQRTQAVFQGIPLFGTCEVTVRIEVATGANCAVGIIMAGVKSWLGHTQYGLSSGITDFSKKETNETFGTTTFVRRGYSKRMSPSVMIPISNLNRIQRTLYNLRAVPALWIASEDPSFEESTVVFGFYRDFSTELSYPTYALCSLEIEGLI